MLIIIIVCVVVVILISVAVIAFCIYKKNQLSKEQGGVEIVAHTKTRPSTPPVNKERNPLLKTTRTRRTSVVPRVTLTN